MAMNIGIVKFRKYDLRKVTLTEAVITLSYHMLIVKFATPVYDLIVY